MSDIKQPHDSVFKKALSNKVIARSFLRHHVDKNLQKNMCFDTLELVPGSFVGRDLKKSFTDVLYGLNLINGRQGYIHVLLEQQRKQEKFMALRLERYKAEIMLQHVHEFGCDKAPIVYPIVIYNGEHKYQQPTDYYDLFDDPEFAKSIMQKPFHLIDLSQLSDKELLRQGYHGVIQTILKHRRISSFKKFFRKILPYLLQLDLIAAGETTASVINYLIYVHDVNDFDTIKQLVKQQFQPETAEAYMTGAERLIQRGEERGIKIGIEQGIEQGRIQLINELIAGGLDVNTVIKYTNLSLDQLKNIIN